MRKLDIPPLVVKRLIRRVVPQPRTAPLVLTLTRPAIPAETQMVRQVYTLAAQPARASVLAQEDEAVVELVVGDDGYTTAVDLATTYRLPALDVYRELKRLYGPDGIVPATHREALAQQIEAQSSAYTIEEEEVEEALALIKRDGFEREEGEEGAVVYTAEIAYPTSKEALLVSWQALRRANEHGFGFHYDPYNFDSDPEKDFFLRMLRDLNQDPAEVEDIYFTGALTDPRKTDFYVDYKGEDGRWHRYSPDFIVRRKDGKAFIVEIKAERERDHPIDGEAGRKALAVRGWTELNPDRLKYEMIFTDGDSVAFNALDPVKAFVKSQED